MRGLAIYTGLRLAVLAAVWILLQLLTPMRGLFALAAALVISGVISFVLLNRSRDSASTGLSRIFGGINDRIERSRTAEDHLDSEESPAGADAPPALGQPDAEAEEQAVGQGEQPGALEDGDQVATDRTP